MQKQNWNVAYFPFALTSLCQAQSFFPVFFQVSLRPSTWVFELLISQICWLAIFWLEPDFITACTQGLSWFFCKALGPRVAYSTVQLNNSGSVSSNQQASQSPQQTKLLAGKTTMTLSEFWETTPSRNVVIQRLWDYQGEQVRCQTRTYDCEK